MENPLGQCLRELPGPLLLTGHTGFKGAWMTFLLERLNVPVVGYSLPPEKDSLFDRAERVGVIPEAFADIRDYKTLENFMDLHSPSTIIHMAAQPLVLKSYENPRETFDVNVMGTANLLDIAFKKSYVKAVVVVTTDKVYKNDDSGRSFIETDPLEGKDPYSASKVGTEATVAAWQQIARMTGGPKIVSVRAGNVIGGGDFAESRLVPDLIRAVLAKEKTIIRNRKSTRPWQHVLEPLTGYLQTLQSVLSGATVSSINFGPASASLSVEEVVQIGNILIPEIQRLVIFNVGDSLKLEADRLNINSELSKSVLDWNSKWSPEEAIELTFKWWREYLNHGVSPYLLCLSDIDSYFHNPPTS